MLKPLITGSLDIRQLYGSQYTIHISVNRPIFERLQIIHHGTNNSNMRKYCDIIRALNPSKKEKT
jgi:hypothetical protein